MADNDTLNIKPGDTYTLKKPIRIGEKILITELTITDDPRAEHLMALDEADGAIGASMHFLAAITNQPIEVVKKIGAKDLMALRPTVQHMMGEFGLLSS